MKEKGIRRGANVIARKLLRLLLLLLFTSVTAFVLMKASPIDPLQANVGQTALGSMSADTSVTAFVLMKASPIDPLQANVGQTALGSMSAEQVAKLEAYWGTGENPLKQYISWLGDFVRGDMGVSLLYRQPVGEVLAVRLQNSLLLMVTAWVLSGVLGVRFCTVSRWERCWRYDFRILCCLW